MNSIVIEMDKIRDDMIANLYEIKNMISSKFLNRTAFFLSSQLKFNSTVKDLVEPNQSKWKGGTPVGTEHFWDSKELDQISGFSSSTTSSSSESKSEKRRTLDHQAPITQNPSPNPNAEKRKTIDHNNFQQQPQPAEENEYLRIMPKQTPKSTPQEPKEREPMPIPPEDSEYLRVPGGKPGAKVSPKPTPKTTPKLEREPMPVPPEENEYLRVPSKSAPKPTPKSIPKPATSTSVWKELKTEDGYPYWFNEETNESRWENPDSF